MPGRNSRNLQTKASPFPPNPTAWPLPIPNSCCGAKRAASGCRSRCSSPNWSWNVARSTIQWWCTAVRACPHRNLPPRPLPPPKRPAMPKRSGRPNAGGVEQRPTTLRAVSAGWWRSTALASRARAMCMYAPAAGPASWRPPTAGPARWESRPSASTSRCRMSSSPTPTSRRT